MNVDVAELLTIDVEAEIRKLAEAELGGPWQVPAELVRRSLRAGATRVDVELAGSSLRVSDDGPAIADASLEALRGLLDVAAAPSARHRALLELEGQGEVGLVALAGLQRRTLRIVCDGAERLRAGDPKVRPVPARGAVIELEGVGLDRAQAKRWLEVAVRFSPASVVLDGVELERGAANAVVEAKLEAPVAGTLALLRSDEPARVWLLRWGVVTTHAMLPGTTGVEAAVELGERGQRQVGAGELRAAFKRELAEVEAQAIELAIATASALDPREPEDRMKVRAMLLASAKVAKSAEVRRVKMLPALYGPSHAREWSSIDQLLHHAQGKSVLAVDTEARAANAVTQAPIFVLSPAERARLSQLFGVAFAPPPSGGVAGPLLSLKGLAESGARAARAAAGAVQGAWQKAVPVEDQTEAERAALEVFKSAVQTSSRKPFNAVELCEGDGAPHVKGRSKTLMLPRGNAEVAAAVALVSADPSWAYTALTALLGGVTMPPSALRARS
ncbi:MAG: hypothetical protein JNK82_18115 [Myxococcaceae bacterium]|nr:hypothetical protein [Myxococcaceae bacterium]